MRCVGARSRPAEASLIVIVHLFLRLQVPYIVVRILVVSFVIYHLVWIVQDLRARVIPLENHGAAGPLLETDASVLGLGAQRDSILRLIDLVVHLARLVPTIDIHRTGPAADFVVSVVMLQIHRVSTHR